MLRLFRPVVNTLQKTQIREFKNVADNIATLVLSDSEVPLFRGVKEMPSEKGMSSTTGSFHRYKENGNTEALITYSSVLKHTGGDAQLGVPVTRCKGVAARFAGKDGYVITFDSKQLGKVIDVDATYELNSKPIDPIDKELQQHDDYLKNILSEKEYIIDGIPKSAVINIESAAELEAEALAEIDRIVQEHKSNTAISEKIADILDKYPKDLVSSIKTLEVMQNAITKLEAEKIYPTLKPK